MSSSSEEEDAAEENDTTRIAPSSSTAPWTSPGQEHFRKLQSLKERENELWRKILRIEDYTKLRSKLRLDTDILVHERDWELLQSQHCHARTYLHYFPEAATRASEEELSDVDKYRALFANEPKYKFLAEKEFSVSEQLAQLLSWATDEDIQSLTKLWFRQAIDGSAIFFPANRTELFLYEIRLSFAYRLCVDALVVFILLSPAMTPRQCLAEGDISRSISNSESLFVLICCLLQFIDVFLAFRTTNWVSAKDKRQREAEARKERETRDGSKESTAKERNPTQSISSKPSYFSFSLFPYTPANHIRFDNSLGWQKLRCVTLALIAINSIMHLFDAKLPNLCMILAPILFVARREQLKQLLHGMYFALKKVTKLLYLAVLFVFGWAFLGFCFLRRYSVGDISDEVRFSTYLQAIYATMHCMLSRPTVLYRLKPIFAENNYASGYFVVLTVLGDIMLTTIIISMGTRAFRKFSLQNMESRLKYRHFAIHSLFRLYTARYGTETASEHGRVAPREDDAEDSENGAKRTRWSSLSVNTVRSLALTLRGAPLANRAKDTHFVDAAMDRDCWLRFVHNLDEEYGVASDKHAILLFFYEALRRENYAVMSRTDVCATGGLIYERSFFRLCGLLACRLEFFTDSLSATSLKNSVALTHAHSPLKAEKERKTKENHENTAGDNDSEDGSYSDDQHATSRVNSVDSATSTSTANTNFSTSSTSTRGERVAGVFVGANRLLSQVHKSVRYHPQVMALRDLYRARLFALYHFFVILRYPPCMDVLFTHVITPIVRLFFYEQTTQRSGEWRVRLFHLFQLALYTLSIVQTCLLAEGSIAVGAIVFQWFVLLFFLLENQILAHARSDISFLEISSTALINFSSFVALCALSASVDAGRESESYRALNGDALTALLIIESMRYVKVILSSKPLQSFAAILPVVGRALLLYLLFLYSFALLGHITLCQRMQADSISAEADDDSSSWIVFSELLNFNTIYSAGYTVAASAVLSNWSMLMDAALKSTQTLRTWVYFYFYVFRFVTVVLVIPLLLSCVIQAFIQYLDKRATEQAVLREEERKDKEREKEKNRESARRSLALSARLSTATAASIAEEDAHEKGRDSIAPSQRSSACEEDSIAPDVNDDERERESERRSSFFSLRLSSSTAQSRHTFSHAHTERDSLALAHSTPGESRRARVTNALLARERERDGDREEDEREEENESEDVHASGTQDDMREAQIVSLTEHTAPTQNRTLSISHWFSRSRSPSLFTVTTHRTDAAALTHTPQMHKAASRSLAQDYFHVTTRDSARGASTDQRDTIAALWSPNGRASVQYAQLRSPLETRYAAQSAARRSSRHERLLSLIVAIDRQLLRCERVWREGVERAREVVVWKGRTENEEENKSEHTSVEREAVLDVIGQRGVVDNSSAINEDKEDVSETKTPKKANRESEKRERFEVRDALVLHTLGVWAKNFDTEKEKEREEAERDGKETGKEGEEESALERARETESDALLSLVRANLPKHEIPILAAQWFAESLSGRALLFPTSSLALRALRLLRGPLVPLVNTLVVLQMCAVFLVTPRCADESASASKGVLSRGALNALDLVCSLVYLTEIALDTIVNHAQYQRLFAHSQKENHADTTVNGDNSQTHSNTSTLASLNKQFREITSKAVILLQRGLLFRFLLVLAIFIKSVYSLFSPELPLSHVRLLRGVFPFFVLSHYAHFSDILFGLRTSFARSRVVYVLFFAIVTLFAVVGYFQFHRFTTHAQRFDSLSTAWTTSLHCATSSPFSLFVLLPYQETVSQLSPLFFLSLTYISEVLCVSLIVGAGSFYFNKYGSAALSKRTRARYRSLRRVFTLLAETPPSHTHKGVEKEKHLSIPTHTPTDKETQGEGEQRVSLTTFCLFSQCLSEDERLSRAETLRLLLFLRRDLHKPLFAHTQHTQHTTTEDESEEMWMSEKEFHMILGCMYKGITVRRLRRSHTAECDRENHECGDESVHGAVREREERERTGEEYYFGKDGHGAALSAALPVASYTLSLTHKEETLKGEHNQYMQEQEGEPISVSNAVCVQSGDVELPAVSPLHTHTQTQQHTHNVSVDAIGKDTFTHSAEREETRENPLQSIFSAEEEEVLLLVLRDDERASWIAPYLPLSLRTHPYTQEVIHHSHSLCFTNLQFSLSFSRKKKATTHPLIRTQGETHKRATTFTMSLLDVFGLSVSLLLIVQLVFFSSASECTSGWAGFGYFLELCVCVELCARVLGCGGERHFAMRERVHMIRLCLAVLVVSCMLALPTSDCASSGRTQSGSGVWDSQNVATAFLMLVVAQALNVLLAVVAMRPHAHSHTLPMTDLKTNSSTLSIPASLSFSLAQEKTEEDESRSSSGSENESVGGSVRESELASEVKESDAETDFAMTMRLYQQTYRRTALSGVANRRFRLSIENSLRAILLLFIVLYFYTIIAQDLFCGVLNPGDVVGSPTNDDDASSWNNFSDILNFNNYPQAMFTLFEVMVLGSWSMVMDAVLYNYEKSSFVVFLFFFTFRLSMAFVFLPLLMAFMVRSFVALHDQIAFIHKRRKKFIRLANQHKEEIERSVLSSSSVTTSAATSVASLSVAVMSSPPPTPPSLSLAQRFAQWKEDLLAGRFLHYYPPATLKRQTTAPFLDIWDSSKLHDMDVLAVQDPVFTRTLIVAENASWKLKQYFLFLASDEVQETLCAAGEESPLVVEVQQLLEEMKISLRESDVLLKQL